MTEILTVANLRNVGMMALFLRKIGERMSDGRKAVAERMMRGMKEMGLSITDLSRESGIGFELVRRSLHGTREIKAQEFIQLCRVLDLTLEDFTEVV